jgi:hypothetical protein
MAERVRLNDSRASPYTSVDLQNSKDGTLNNLSELSRFVICRWPLIKHGAVARQKHHVSRGSRLPPGVPMDQEEDGDGGSASDSSGDVRNILSGNDDGMDYEDVSLISNGSKTHC